MRVLATAIGLLIGLTGAMSAATPATAAQGEYRLEFLPTFNIGESSGAGGTMTIRVHSDRHSTIDFRVWNLYPNTVYTIWTVFNNLAWRPGYFPDSDGDGVADSNGVPACGASGGNCSVATGWKGWQGYPPEGGKVSPTGSLKSAYTHGIRLDPGSTFVTDKNGNGHIAVRLDFDALDANPVSLKQLLQQCRPGKFDPATGKCATSNDVVDITTTWMRVFIGEYPVHERAAKCANYNADFDPEAGPVDPQVVHHTDARYWQCVDPETDLVRVRRFPVNHFRIANHPDALTHGHIGGDHNDHWIDLVGPRECIVPVGNAAPIAQLEPNATSFTPFPTDQCRPLTHPRKGGRRDRD
jgi:hypothetical protein